MALGDLYVSTDELKARVKIKDDQDDLKAEWAVKASSRGIELFTHRQFNLADAATPRVYVVANPRGSVFVDDMSAEPVMVECDYDGDGVFEDVWTGGYDLYPANGIVNGQEGWPFNELRTTGRKCWPACGGLRVRVTDRWGWLLKPDPVLEAARIIAEDIFKLADAPFGVAGFGEYGALRIRMNGQAMALLDPYMPE